MRLINWIKDVIYDKSDAFVALIIIAAAALIITWRIGCIMEYPELAVQAAQNAAVSESTSEGAIASDGALFASGTSLLLTGDTADYTDPGEGAAYGEGNAPAEAAE